MQRTDSVKDVPDDVWAVFEPILPPVVWKGNNGRKPKGNRECLHALLYVLIAGIGRELLPRCFPSCKTVRRRLKRWPAAASKPRRCWGRWWSSRRPPRCPPPSPARATCHVPELMGPLAIGRPGGAPTPRASAWRPPSAARPGSRGSVGFAVRWSAAMRSWPNPGGLPAGSAAPSNAISVGFNWPPVRPSSGATPMVLCGSS